MRLVLASTSPRRAELLRGAGFTFDVVPAEVDERIRGGELPGDYVRRVALEKSAAVLERLAASGATPAVGKREDLVVLGADTAVVGMARFSANPRRPRGRRHAAEVFGAAPRGLTGVSLRSRSAERGLVETTSVYMMDLRDEDIAWYSSAEKGGTRPARMDPGLASRFIPRIDGSHANVVGLPSRKSRNS
jgi:septum formation protein